MKGSNYEPYLQVFYSRIFSYNVTMKILCFSKKAYIKNVTYHFANGKNVSRYKNVVYQICLTGTLALVDIVKVSYTVSEVKEAKLPFTFYISYKLLVLDGNEM